MGKLSKDTERTQRLSHFTIEQAPDAILWLDSEGHICHINDAATRMFGYSRDEIIGVKAYGYTRKRMKKYGGKGGQS